MFESVLIRRHTDTPRSVDPGTIAEALLFYEHVHIVADRSLFIEILQMIGADNLLRMLKENLISLTYVREILGVMTNTQPTGLQFHSLTAFQVGTKEKKHLSNAEELTYAVEVAIGKSRRSKHAVRDILDRVSFRTLGASEALPQGFPTIAREDLRDAQFVKAAIQDTIRSLVPNIILPDRWAFSIMFADENSFVVGTDLNFEKLNEQYHKIYPIEHSSLTPAYLLSFLYNARADAYFAADYMSEIVTTPLSSRIINMKMQELLSKRDRNARQIEMFQEQHLDNARAVREVLNSGERKFEEFLDLLERAQKFKVWLRGRNPDSNLIREYYKAATAESWIDRLPSKSLRFVIATLGGLGADMLFPTGGVGTAIGVGIGATDSMLVDRLLKGWRPNHFIEGELQQFISDSKK